MASRKNQTSVSGLSLSRPIVLIGMMGAGKSTVGRRLAARLNLPFFDADHEIETAAGMTVTDLFALHGEESFRRGEAQVIARLLSGAPMVVATGGGAVVTAETRDLIKEKAISVWLRADLDTIFKRASRRPTRPLLKTADPRATLARLMAEREAYYAQADLTVDSGVGPNERTVDAVVAALVTLQQPQAGEP